MEYRSQERHRLPEHRSQERQTAQSASGGEDGVGRETKVVPVVIDLTQSFDPIASINTATTTTSRNTARNTGMLSYDIDGLSKDSATAAAKRKPPPDSLDDDGVQQSSKKHCHAERCKKDDDDDRKPAAKVHSDADDEEMRDWKKIKKEFKAAEEELGEDIVCICDCDEDDSVPSTSPTSWENAKDMFLLARSKKNNIEEVPIEVSSACRILPSRFSLFGSSVFFFGLY